MSIKRYGHISCDVYYCICFRTFKGYLVQWYKGHQFIAKLQYSTTTIMVYHRQGTACTYSDATLDVYPVLATSRSLMKRKMSENVLGFSPSLPHKNGGIRLRIDHHYFLSSSFRFVIYQSILKISKCMCFFFFRYYVLFSTSFESLQLQSLSRLFFPVLYAQIC